MFSADPSVLPAPGASHDRDLLEWLRRVPRAARALLPQRELLVGQRQAVDRAEQGFLRRRDRQPEPIPPGHELDDRRDLSLDLCHNGAHDERADVPPVRIPGRAARGRPRALVVW
jgi:hypothetical protein